MAKNSKIVGVTQSLMEIFKEQDRNKVQSLCKELGYGNVMYTVADLWNKETGDMGSNMTIGPCKIMLVPCICKKHSNPESCDWCCGVGMVTKKVAMLQKNYQMER